LTRKQVKELSAAFAGAVSLAVRLERIADDIAEGSGMLCDPDDPNGDVQRIRRAAEMVNGAGRELNSALSGFIREDTGAG